MLRPNIIKIPAFSDWLFTFTILDPDTGLPATQDNTYAKFCLYEHPMDKTPLWSCEWNTGIQENPVKPGVIHVVVPRKISDYLPPGIYTYSLDIVSKSNPDKTRKDCGTIESVRMDPNGGVQFGVSDNVARQMIGKETTRAMRAEEELREDIGSGEIPDGSVTTEKLANQAVTRAKIAEGVIPDPLPQKSVSTDMLRDGCVTTDKIADGAVTADKIAGASIAEALPDESIGSTKLSNNAVTRRALAQESVGAEQVDQELIADIDDIAASFAEMIDIGDVHSAGPDDSPSVGIRKFGTKWLFDFYLVPGATPEIGDDGYWYIFGDKTEYRAIGQDGAGILSIELTSSNPDTGEDTYTIAWGTSEDNVSGTQTFTIQNSLPTTAALPESNNPIQSGAVYTGIYESAPATSLPDMVALTASVNGTQLSRAVVETAYSNDVYGNIIPAQDEYEEDGETVVNYGIKSLLENNDVAGSVFVLNLDLTSVSIDNNDLISCNVKIGFSDQEDETGASASGMIVSSSSVFNITSISCDFSAQSKTADITATNGTTQIVLPLVFEVGDIISRVDRYSRYITENDLLPLVSIIKSLQSRVAALEV